VGRRDLSAPWKPGTVSPGRGLSLGLLSWYPVFMGKSIFKGTPKKRGRPATTGRGLQIGMRWQDPDLEMIDDWIEKQKEPFTRPEAIRRLVEIALKARK
jgi:hypothetical protein